VIHLTDCTGFRKKRQSRRLGNVTRLCAVGQTQRFVQEALGSAGVRPPCWGAGRLPGAPPTATDCCVGVVTGGQPAMGDAGAARVHRDDQGGCAECAGQLGSRRGAARPCQGAHAAASGPSAGRAVPQQRRRESGRRRREAPAAAAGADAPYVCLRLRVEHGTIIGIDFEAGMTSIRYCIGLRCGGTLIRYRRAAWGGGAAAEPAPPRQPPLGVCSQQPPSSPPAPSPAAPQAALSTRLRSPSPAVLLGRHHRAERFATVCWSLYRAHPLMSPLPPRDLTYGSTVRRRSSHRATVWKAASTGAGQPHALMP
jgi:hypothetical protein